jgi:hypothetical protein
MKIIKFKKVKVVILVNLIFLSCFIYYVFNYKSTPVNSDNTVKLEVKLSDIDEIYNNHVGNSWAFKSVINDEVILNKNKAITMSLNLNDKIKLYVEAVEQDTSPDTGSEIKIINVKDIDLDKINEYSIKVSVKEDKGRYSGSTAVHNFNFTNSRELSSIEKIRTLFNKRESVIAKELEQPIVIQTEPTVQYIDIYK